ncbi:MAG: hypothetical protein ACM31C_11420 [Acidobacteriota bacterium]
MIKLVFVACALAACGAMPQKTEDTLVESIRSYNEGIRWSRFEVAAVRVPPAQRSQFVDDWDQRAKDLKITDYELVRVDQKGPKAAKAQIKLEWYRDSEGTVHETSAIQTWERHGKAWYVVDETRLRGTEMPGLPEPLMSDGGSGPAAPR